MRLKQHACAAVVVGGILVASAESRGDSMPALSAEQTEAKTAFEEATKTTLAELKTKCPDVTVATPDFEHFDKKKWMELQRGGRSRLYLGGDCAIVLDEVTRRCAASSAPRDRDAPKGKPSKGSSDPAPVAKGPPVKSIACVFAGAQDEQKGDDADDHLMRNLTLKDGALTLRLHPRLANVQWNASSLISSGGADPKGEKRVGLSCAANADCKSKLCAAGTCKICTEDSACGKGRVCSANKCWVPRDSSDDEPSSSSSSSPARAADPDKNKKGLGQSCKSSSECASRYTCKPVSKSRSTCR